jgi:hypothetical protein
LVAKALVLGLSIVDLRAAAEAVVLENTSNTNSVSLNEVCSQFQPVKKYRDPVGASCSILYHSTGSRGLQGPLIAMQDPLGLLLPLQEIQIPVL